MNCELGIRELCAKYGIRPSKKLGQNFVVDESVIEKMVEAAELGPDDHIVEIGPGFGMLTQAIAKKVEKIVAVEVDKKLFRTAQGILRSYNNVEVVEGDILKITNHKLAAMLETKDYKVVANLPYSITSAVLRKFIEPSVESSLRDDSSSLSDGRPNLIVVMVQKEVAERVCAKPGEMSVLSVAVQYYGKPELVAIVPASAFWPEPEVESAILKIDVTKGYKGLLKVTKSIDEKHLFQLVRMGFSSRRKQLQNNLAAGLRLPRKQVIEVLGKAGLNPMVRPQELSVDNWIVLARVF